MIHLTPGRPLVLRKPTVSDFRGWPGKSVSILLLQVSSSPSECNLLKPSWRCLTPHPALCRILGLVSGSLLLHSGAAILLLDAMLLPEILIGGRFPVL